MNMMYIKKKKKQQQPESNNKESQFALRLKVWSWHEQNDDSIIKQLNNNSRGPVAPTWCVNQLCACLFTRAPVCVAAPAHVCI